MISPISFTASIFIPARVEPMFTLEHTKKVMRSDELPIIVLERAGAAKKLYPERVEWEEWCEIFKKEQKLQ